jgi:hypothetical protein
MAFETGHTTAFLISFLLYPLVLFPQSSPDSKSVQGVLLQYALREGVWQAAVRTTDSGIVRFFFDSNIVIERNHQAIEPAALAPGETLEVLLVESSGSVLRRAEAIHVLSGSGSSSPAAEHCGSDGVASNRPAWFSNPALHSGISIAGVILRCSGSRLLIQTRNSGDRTVILSPNTRYFENGESVRPDRLEPHMRIFVTAASGLFGDLEAAQVVWGTILRPQ